MARNKFKYQIKGTRGKRYRRLDIEGGTTVVNNTITGDGAPSDEPFITHAAGSSALTNNRVLTQSDSGWITLSDAGVDDGALKIEIGTLEQNKLLGRANSAGTGVPQIITLGTGLSMTGDVLSATGGGGGPGAPINATYICISHDGDLTNERSLAVSSELTISDAGANSTVTLSITADGVTLAMLQNIADGTVLGNNTGGSANPVEIAVNTSHLSLATDGATGSGSKLGLATNGTGNTHIRQSAGFSVVGKATTGTGNVADITCAPDRILGRNASGDLGFAQLVTGQCADDQITYPKMQNISAASRLLGRGSAGGSGDPQELTVSTGLSISGTALSCTITQYTDELAQDAVGTILVDSSEINFTYSDMTPSITASLIDGSIALARIVNITDDRLLGRSAGSDGPPMVITVGSPLTLDSGALDFDETVTLGNNARVAVRKNSTGTVSTRRRLNLIEGSNVTITVADDAGNEEIDVTIASSGGSGSPAGSDTQVQYNDGGVFGADVEFFFNDSTKQVSARIFNSEPSGIITAGQRLGTFRFGNIITTGAGPELYCTFSTSDNLFWGAAAGNGSHTTAAGNIGIGNGSLAAIVGGANSNTSLGDEAGASITGEGYNTCLGAESDIDAGTNPFSAVALGYQTVATISSSVAIAARTLEMDEMSDPAGASNKARLFARDNGAGKTQLCVIFGSGAVQVLATEP